MVKKIVLFTVLVILSNFIIVSADSLPEIETVLSDLTNLKIIDEADDPRTEDALTRAEAVAMICRADGVGDLSHVNVAESPYSDVAINHWAIKYIDTLTASGVIDGDENDFFYPDRAITLDEMRKMLISVLGYSDQAENWGGYPWGYNSYAEILDLDITGKSLPGDEPITREIGMKMIYKALDLPTMEKKEAYLNGEYIFRYIEHDGGMYPLLTLRMKLENSAENN